MLAVRAMHGLIKVKAGAPAAPEVARQALEVYRPCQGVRSDIQQQGYSYSGPGVRAVRAMHAPMHGGTVKLERLKFQKWRASAAGSLTFSKCKARPPAAAILRTQALGCGRCGPCMPPCTVKLERLKPQKWRGRRCGSTVLNSQPCRPDTDQHIQSYLGDFKVLQVPRGQNPLTSNNMSACARLLISTNNLPSRPSVELTCKSKSGALAPQDISAANTNP